MKGRDGRMREPGMTRLVKRNKETYDRIRHLKTNEDLEESSKSRKEF